MADMELTAAEAAKILGVSKDTILRRIKRGELPYRKDGERFIVYLPEDTAAQEKLKQSPTGDPTRSAQYIGLQAEYASALRRIRDLEEDIEKLEKRNARLEDQTMELVQQLTANLHTLTMRMLPAQVEGAEDPQPARQPEPAKKRKGIWPWRK